MWPFSLNGHILTSNLYSLHPTMTYTVKNKQTGRDFCTLIDWGLLLIQEFAQAAFVIWQVLLDSDHGMDQSNHRCVFGSGHQRVCHTRRLMEVSELQEADNATISSPYHADVFLLISGFGTNHHDMTLSLCTRGSQSCCGMHREL